MMVYILIYIIASIVGYSVVYSLADVLAYIIIYHNQCQKNIIYHVRIFILYYKSLSIKIEGIDDKLTIGCGPQTKILNFCLDIF